MPYYRIHQVLVLTAIAFVAVLIETSAIQPVIDNSKTIQQEFDDWSNVYGKHYTDTEKNTTKFLVFLENRAFVIAHNANTNNSVHNFNIELTQYADITQDEYRKLGLPTRSSYADLDNEMYRQVDELPGMTGYYYESVYFRQFVRTEKTVKWYHAKIMSGSEVAGKDPVSIQFKIKLETYALKDFQELIIRSNRPIWSSVGGSVSCSCGSPISSTIVSKYKLKIQPTANVTIGVGDLVLLCTGGLSNNGPAGNVTFDIFSNSHPDALGLYSQAGYTIKPSSMTWTSALPTNNPIITGTAPGNLEFTFGITTDLVTDDKITIFSTKPVWEKSLGPIYISIPISSSLLNGNTISIKSSSDLWVDLGNSVMIDDETTPCIDDGVNCSDVRKPCTAKIDDEDISSDNFDLNFINGYTLNFIAKADNIITAGKELKLTCHNNDERGALGNINYNIVNNAPGKIQFTFEITNKVVATHSIIIVSNYDIWDVPDTTTTCSATESDGEVTNNFIAKTYPGQQNALIITATDSGINPGTFEIKCINNIKSVDSYASLEGNLALQGGVLEFELFAHPDKYCETGWLIGPLGKCYKYVSALTDKAAAENFCVQLDAHLASIHSLEEHDFIYSTVITSTGDAWIGVNADKKSWIDASNWNYVKWDVLNNEPDNEGGFDDCTAIRKSPNAIKDNTWHTANCEDNKYASICMKKSVSYVTGDREVISNLDPITTYTAKRGIETTCGGSPSIDTTTRALSNRALVITATSAISAGTYTLTCTDNIANHGPVGDVKFFIASTRDTEPLVDQTGYTIIGNSSV